MKLGLDSYSYRRAAGLWDYTLRENQPMTVPHFLEKAADLRLDGVHLSDARHLDSFDYGYISDLKRRADDLGLYLELGASGTNPDHLETLVRAAHVLGSRVVVTQLQAPRLPSTERMERAVSQVAEQLGSALPVCERYGVSLAVAGGELTTAEVLTLLEIVDSRWVGVCVDTGDRLGLLEDPMESARSFGRLIRSVRLTDYQVAPAPEGFHLLGCPLGEGVVDLQGILDLAGAESPAARVAIRSATATPQVPVLEEAYLRLFPEVPASALGAALRRVRDRSTDDPLFVNEAATEESELLAAEEDTVVRSIQWLGEVLGRPELGEIDG